MDSPLDQIGESWNRGNESFPHVEISGFYREFASSSRVVCGGAFISMFPGKSIRLCSSTA